MSSHDDDDMILKISLFLPIYTYIQCTTNMSSFTPTPPSHRILLWFKRVQSLFSLFKSRNNFHFKKISQWLIISHGPYVHAVWCEFTMDNSAKNINTNVSRYIFCIVFFSMQSTGPSSQPNARSQRMKKKTSLFSHDDLWISYSLAIIV